METGLGAKLRAYDMNASTRLINNRNVVKAEHIIEPLVAVADGADIPGFPQTVNQINTMTGKSIQNFL